MRHSGKTVIEKGVVTGSRARSRPRLEYVFSLSGRVALVTGGNGDLGLAMALGLRDARWTVFGRKIW